MGVKFKAKNVGVRVLKLRRAALWTQTDLADQLGVSKGWISRLEHGSVNPSLHRVIELARIFDTTPDGLLA